MITAPAISSQPSPSSTPGPTTQCGPILQLGWTLAARSTTAVGCTRDWMGLRVGVFRRVGTLLGLARIGDELAGDGRLARQLVADVGVALHLHRRLPPVEDVDLDAQLVARHHRLAAILPLGARQK